jgi:signal peptidase II
MARCSHILAILTITMVMLADQLSKWYMLEMVKIAERPPIEVTSFFNLVMVWNKGVSFGMLSQSQDWMPWLLIAVAIVISGILSVWLWRSQDRFISLALGLVIGGALGNVIDRVRFKAVADFFDFHMMGYHWPAFNIADSAICVGVALLLWDGLIRSKRS